MFVTPKRNVTDRLKNKLYVNGQHDVLSLFRHFGIYVKKVPQFLIYIWHGLWPKTMVQFSKKLFSWNHYSKLNDRNQVLIWKTFLFDKVCSRNLAWIIA